jgi:hypothetical protein
MFWMYAPTILRLTNCLAIAIDDAYPILLRKILLYRWYLIKLIYLFDRIVINMCIVSFDIFRGVPIRLEQVKKTVMLF